MVVLQRLDIVAIPLGEARGNVNELREDLYQVPSLVQLMRIPSLKMRIAN